MSAILETDEAVACPAARTLTDECAHSTENRGHRGRFCVLGVASPSTENRPLCCLCRLRVGLPPADLRSTRHPQWTSAVMNAAAPRKMPGTFAMMIGQSFLGFRNP